MSLGKGDGGLAAGQPHWSAAAARGLMGQKVTWVGVVE